MLAYSYIGFCKHFNLSFIPVESEIDELIAAMGKRWATYLQPLKEAMTAAYEV
jgi:hypothetical protein